MNNVYEISPQIYQVGGNDRRIERFENMFPLPNGVAYNSYLIADDVEYDSYFLDEARRYYSNIVGRYGKQVQGVLKKFTDLPINMICSLHGLIWRGDKVAYILDKYDTWSSYLTEKKGVVLAYGSM